MNLSISNIAWTADQDEQAYSLMQQYGFTGLEIAPTRIFLEKPYDQLDVARDWAENLKDRNGFVVPSMQSIWYGRQERIFGTQDEYETLVDYTEKAINFAAAIGCHNLVFGCPRNRNIPDGVDSAIGVKFFKTIGDYAVSKGTVIGMEANPPIYNTNYINDTASALQLIDQVNSDGFRLNLDLGTMICNEESVDILRGKVSRINHVHISEPGLKPIDHRELHRQIRQLLLDENYQGFVSIEMGKTDDVSNVESAMQYVSGLF